MKKNYEVLTVDLEDDCIPTDEETLFTLTAVHKLLARVRDASRIGLEYVTVEEDSDIKGIMYLNFEEGAKHAKKHA
jgi:hypothetical protein